jgi:hypothetical protein
VRVADTGEREVLASIADGDVTCLDWSPTLGVLATGTDDEQVTVLSQDGRLLVRRRRCDSKTSTVHPGVLIRARGDRRRASRGFR